MPALERSNEPPRLCKRGPGLHIDQGPGSIYTFSPVSSHGCRLFEKAKRPIPIPVAVDRHPTWNLRDTSRHRKPIIVDEPSHNRLLYAAFCRPGPCCTLRQECPDRGSGAGPAGGRGGVPVYAEAGSMKPSRHTRLKGILRLPAFPTGFIDENSLDRMYEGSLPGPAGKFIFWRASSTTGES